MPAPANCLECNAPLGPGDTGGVCPKCLLKLGLASQLASGTLPASAQGLRADGAIEEPFEFGGHRILRLLGKGGMGAVYEAEQIESGRRVALKVLGQSLDTPEMRQRFVREGQLAASVRHGNVVAVLGAGEAESTPVITMELLHAGTLKDTVKRNGPLAPQEAVDVTLQIVAGLEAAHAAGVLHRDVKPANCFQAEDGTVKVGDFGLSISTLAKAEQSLTQSGTVLGTPAFAAPEQLRGEEVDARADIYAVGATLYYLLTGKPAFEEDSLVALIANVLEKSPAPVGEQRAGIPAGLQAVVMRCLEKQRDRRFRGYAELRAALKPFSSTAPTPGTLGLRFAAGLVDFLGTSVPAIIGLALWGDAPETHWISDRSAGLVLAFGAGLGWSVGWFALPEGIWGRSFGKLLCGLRVTCANGQPIGFGHSLARALIFSLNTIVTPLVTALLYSAEHYRNASQAGEWLPSDWLWFLLFLPLFVTMRRRNGYAAIHDLATGTRVVEENAVPQVAPRAEPFIPDGLTTSADRVGPYVVLGRQGEIAEGFDPVLRRRVWIWFREEGAPFVNERRREIVRPSRLRWLQGKRGPGENWDAFDRPHGGPLLARADGREPWQTARVWLADLADELHASLNANIMPAAVSLQHVWITDGGHAVLLDFPAPGAAEAPARAITSAEHAQMFLGDCAAAAVSPVMPLHARSFLATCRERRLEATAIVAGNLRALSERRATVEPRRRALSATLVFIVVLALLAVMGAIVGQTQGAFDRWWAQAHPEMASPRLGLELMTPVVLNERKEPRGLTRYLSANYGHAILGDSFWTHPRVKALEEFGLIERPVEYHIAADLARLEAGAKPPQNAELETVLKRQAIVRSAWFWPLVGAMQGTAVACALGVLIALAFRVSPMLRIFGFAVVREDGAPAERWRLALRALIASAPVFAISLWLHSRAEWMWRPEQDGWPFGIGVVIAIAIAGIVGLATGRGIGERATGTWIVPK